MVNLEPKTTDLMPKQQILYLAPLRRPKLRSL